MAVKTKTSSNKTKAKSKLITKKKAVVRLSILSMLIIIFGILCVVPFAVPGTDWDFKGFANVIRLGLDLQGGVSAVFDIRNHEEEDRDVEVDEINATISSLQSLLFVRGFAEATVIHQVGGGRYGNGSIRIEVPALEDPDEIFELIGRPAFLEFRGEGVEDGFLTGRHVENARAVFDPQTNQPVVELTFNAVGTERFAQITEQLLNQPLGIYVNGEPITRPTVQSVITNGRAVITGQTNFQEAEALATRIRSGSMSVRLAEATEARVISPTLGQGVIMWSIIAGAIGVLLIMIFLIIMYRGLGVAASISLLAYVVLVIVMLAALPWIQLSLAGIGGIILGVGMAIDANIVIFERIKDEFEKGKSVPVAIAMGFKRSLAAVLDANVTTILTAIVIYLLGPPALQSFALALIVSIGLSLVTALGFTRFCVNSFLAFRKDDPAFYNLKTEGDGYGRFRKFIERLKKVRITQNFKRWFIVSAGVLVIGMGVFTGTAIADGHPRYGFNLGLDFTGGTILEIDYAGSTVFAGAEGQNFTDIELRDEQIESIIAAMERVISETRDANNELVFYGMTVPDFISVQPSGFASDGITIRFQNIGDEDTAARFNAAVHGALTEYLQEAYGDTVRVWINLIAPTAAGALLNRALLAVGVALLVSLVYITIRFKWHYAIAAILNILHDVILLMAVVVIFRFNINAAFIAAITTIVGYSTNNIIVTFDRVRENIGLEENKNKFDVHGLASRSIAETFTRSLFNTITTSIMVVLLAILAGAPMREFAFPILAGLLLGLYSAVFVAPSLLAILLKGGMEKQALKKQEMLDQVLEGKGKDEIEEEVEGTSTKKVTRLLPKKAGEASLLDEPVAASDGDVGAVMDVDVVDVEPERVSAEPEAAAPQQKRPQNKPQQKKQVYGKNRKNK